MAGTFSVECPRCHAKGELADTTLLGQAISCPSCQQVFMVVAPPSAPAPDPLPQPQAPPVQPVAGVPQMTASGVAPAMEEPVLRSNFASRKQPSKLIPILIGSTISSVVLAWLVMFLFGIPLGPQPIQPDKPTAKKEPRRPRRRTTNPQVDTSVAGNIGQPSDPDNPESMTESNGTTTPPLTPTDSAVLGQNRENMPAEWKHKLDNAYGPDSVEILIAALSHEHAGVRNRAAELLSYRDDVPGVVPPLLKTLRDPSPAVRESSAQALGKNGRADVEVIPALGAIVQKDPQRDVRRAAAYALKQLGTGDADRAKAVAGQLIPAFNAAAAEDVGYLAQAFGPLGAEADPIVPRLRQLVNQESTDPEVFGTLAELGHVEELGPLIVPKGLENYSIKTRIAVGLGRQTAMTAPMLELLKTMSQDTDEQVRAAAIRALETCEPKLAEAVPTIEQAQADPDEYVRQAAAAAIAKYDINPEKKIRGLLKQMTLVKAEAWERSSIGNSIRELRGDAFRILLDVISDPEAPANMKEAAAQVLADNWNEGPEVPENTERIRRLLADTEQSLTIRAACAVALQRIRQPSPLLESTLRAAVADLKVITPIRQQALQRVDESNPEWIPILIQAAQQFETMSEAGVNENEYVYRRVLEALAGTARNTDNRNRPDIVAPFLAALKAKKTGVQSTALDALAEVTGKSAEGAAAARDMMKSPDPYVHSRAIYALGNFGEVAHGSISEIRAALKDKTDSVRDAAAWALGEFGVAAKDAVPELIPGVTTDDATRNRYAPRALARIAPNDEEVVATLSRGLENNDLRDSIIDAIQELGPNAAAYLPALKKVIPVTDKSSLYDVFRIVEALGPAGKPALPEMIAFLSGPDRDLREYSLQAIGAMKDQAADAIPEIVKCVSDKNEDVARKAVNTLVRIGEPAKAAIPDLEAAVAATESKDLKDLLQIAIGRLSSPLTGLDAEVNDFLDSDREWTVLQQKFPNETLASLIQSIIRLRRNPDRTVSQRASSMLTYAQHVPAAREELVKLLSSEDVSQQAIAAMILARMPSTGDKLELARQLQTMIEADEQSHYVGVSLILQCGRPAIPIVASLLTSGATKSSHRESLLRSVAYTNNFYLPPLLEQLREAMKSDNVSTRQSAIVALAVLNPREPELLPRVLECLESDEPSFKTMAAGALTEMSRCGVDVKVAIPKLVAMLTQATANSGERDDGRARTFGAAAAVLKEVGIRKEDAPAVRSILQAALEAEGDGDKYRYSEIAQNGNTAIHLLSSLGPDAAEVLPDVKRFILRTQQVYDADVLANFGEPAIQMLIELTHPDQQSPVRTAALQALVDTRGDFRETIDPRLIELMKDADLAVRARAAIAQGKTNDPAVVAVLVESLQGADDQLQSVLLPHLGGLGEAAAPAVPRLLELVNHPDSRAWTRFQQMQTLLRIAPRNPEVDAALLSYLKQEKDYIHITSHEERLIPLLIQWVGEQPAPVAQRAAVMLQDFDEKAKDAVPALQKLMNAAEAGEASVDAAMALAHIDPATPDVAPRLIAAFDQRYRDYAYLEALRRLGPASSELLPKVIARIEAGDENLYGVLGAMGLAAKPTVPKLMAVLNDSNNYYGALEALRMLSSVAPEIGEQIQADLQNEERRLAAILKLNILGPRAEFALPMLIDLSQGTDLQWRTASLQALRGIEGHDAEIVPLLAAALSDPDPRVVSAAASALAAHAKGAESALPQLIAALEAPDKAPKWMLINVASEMGTAAKDTVPVLEKMSKASDRHLRASAKRAIDKIQGRTANDE